MNPYPKSKAVIVKLSPEVEAKLREFVAKYYGSKRGLLSYVVEKAILEFIERYEKEE